MNDKLLVINLTTFQQPGSQLPQEELLKQIEVAAALKPEGKLSTIEHLNLADCGVNLSISALTSSAVPSPFQISLHKLPNLERVDLCNHPELDDWALDTLRSNCPRLKTIYLNSYNNWHPGLIAMLYAQKIDINATLDVLRKLYESSRQLIRFKLEEWATLMTEYPLAESEQPLAELHYLKRYASINANCHCYTSEPRYGSSEVRDIDKWLSLLRLCNFIEGYRAKLKRSQALANNQQPQHDTLLYQTRRDAHFAESSVCEPEHKSQHSPSAN